MKCDKEKTVTQIYSGPYPYSKMSWLNSVVKENALEAQLDGKFGRMDGKFKNLKEQSAGKFEKLEKRSANCVFR